MTDNVCKAMDPMMEFARLQLRNGPDEYDHDLPELIYTVSSVPGPGADVEHFNCVFTQGCACVNGKCCAESSCECLSSQGANYSAGRLLENKFAGPVLECGSACSCSAGSCENRLVQIGPWRGLKTFQAPNNKGTGLATTSRIAAGCFICEYAGEIIDLNEARRRSARDTVNYILVLNEHRDGHEVRKTCVDPSAIGNVGRYANHSCDPNAAVVPVRFDDLVPRLALFAKRDVAVGEEITFDYGDGEVNDDAGVSNEKPCFCGEDNCKGFLPFNKDLL